MIGRHFRGFLLDAEYGSHRSVTPTDCA